MTYSLTLILHQEISNWKERICYFIIPTNLIYIKIYFSKSRNWKKNNKHLNLEIFCSLTISSFYQTIHWRWNGISLWLCKYNLFISFRILLYVAIVTPFKVAYIDNEGIGWQSMDYLTDFVFIIDIFMTFFVAYFDKN